MSGRCCRSYIEIIRMDPLSITASLIAIITLTGTVATSLNELRTVLKDASDDLLTLLDEIKDFQAVLSSIRDIGPESSADAFLELSTLPSRAKNKLLELEKLLHYKITPPCPNYRRESRGAQTTVVENSRQD